MTASLKEFRANTPDEVLQSLGVKNVQITRENSTPNLSAPYLKDTYWQTDIDHPYSPKTAEIGVLFYISTGQPIPDRISQACLEGTEGNINKLATLLTAWDSLHREGTTPPPHSPDHHRFMRKAARAMAQPERSVDQNRYALIIAGLNDFRSLAYTPAFTAPDLPGGDRIMREGARAGSGYDIQAEAFKRLGPVLQDEFNLLQTSGKIRQWAERNKAQLTPEELKEFHEYADYIGALMGYQDEEDGYSVEWVSSG